MKFERIEIDFASKTDSTLEKNAAGIKKNIPFSKKNSKNRKKIITMKFGRGQFELHILISRTNIELTFISELLLFKQRQKVRSIKSRFKMTLVQKTYKLLNRIY